MNNPSRALGFGQETFLEACVFRSRQDGVSYLPRCRLSMELNFSDDPAAEHESIVCRNIGSNSGGPDCIDFVRRQIQECEDYHKDCPGAIIPALPTRILDLGTYSTDIKLVQSEGLCGKYAALSHCWGSPGHPPTKTLSTNVEERMRRIKFGDLSTVFQEAVTATRSLGMQYIWIDALCIIQDSKADVCLISNCLSLILGQYLISATVTLITSKYLEGFVIESVHRFCRSKTD